MKKEGIILIALILCSLIGFGQSKVLEKKVNLDFTDQSIELILKEISDQTNARFAYNPAIIPIKKKISIQKTNISIRKVLEIIFKGEQISYKSTKTQISLFKKKADKKQFTLSGYIKDKSSDESLIQATVYIMNKGQGTTSNNYGFYSLTLEEGDYQLRFSYIGYTTQIIDIKLYTDRVANIVLKPSIELKEVTVVASASEKSFNRAEMGVHTIPLKEIKKIPVLLGETDILKTLQLLPGIQSGNEGSSGIYVRGGGHDQNLIMLDGVPLYNVSHLFGFFSVFNTDAINNAKMIKGGFPARYGGRLSSVLDIRMKEGNMNEFHGSGSIGLISSRISLEGPINKGKTSFIISARRTYIDILAKPALAIINSKNDNEDNSFSYYFYDLNMKINHKFSPKSRLFLSAYLGKDDLNGESTYRYQYSDSQSEDINGGDVEWGNIIGVARWNYQLNSKLFSNTTFTYSRYKFDAGNYSTQKNTTDGNTSTYNSLNKFRSGINDLTAKIDFDFLPNPNHYIKFGFGNTYHEFQPSGAQFEWNDGEEINLSDTENDELKANEYFAYIENDFKIGSKIKFNLGLHFSGFTYKEKTFNYLQPRANLNILLSKNSSLKLSYARMAQYLHLLTNPTVGLPTDLWVPPTKKVPAEYSDQFAIGYSKEINDNYNLNIEAYYKKMYNLVEYKEGSSFFGSSKGWEDKVDLGTGESYGVEVFIEKRSGKTTGWFGYTLSWANRNFENIDNGETFPFRYDRRHDVSLVLTHKLKKNIDLGFIWVYGSGQAITLGLEKYNPIDLGSGFNPYGDIEHHEKRNNYRTPAYHRMDVNINFTKKKKWGTRTWSVGLYNAYSRQNPFFMYVEWDMHKEVDVVKQLSIFPIIPSVSYSFKF